MKDLVQSDTSKPTAFQALSFHQAVQLWNEVPEADGASAADEGVCPTSEGLPSRGHVLAASAGSCLEINDQRRVNGSREQLERG